LRFVVSPLTSTNLICATPPANPSRGLRFEVSPLTSTILSPYLIVHSRA
jgi:hypothetical protein